MAKLVIVESPAKANTIRTYLGTSYKVIASKGHIRDLPKSTLGIDVENGFLPHYINIRGKGELINELKKEARAASKIFLATDPDREGEAISWHIANQLNIPLDETCRVTFNEITKNAVREAIKAPRKINMDLVNSQQARRILDRLVGFNISQVLWKNVGSGLSGGRVQSVATRIITEREKEIKSFVPKEYWTIEALLTLAGGGSVECKFYGDKSKKNKLSCEADASLIYEKIKNGKFNIESVKHTEKKRMPSPPFTTSTLQQEASKKLGFQSQKTMKIAQELYDGLYLGQELGGTQGLITYMRTDSTRVSSVAIFSAKDFIKAEYGENYLPRTARIYKNKNASQDAHEAIRPSDVNITPEKLNKVLTDDQYKLYKLIWERFIASQMTSAVIDTVNVDIENSGYIFKTGYSVVKSYGFMCVYNSEDEDLSLGIIEKNVPELFEGMKISSSKLEKKQHFTEPPAHYTEAALIKFLEENGIGRPSTYAPIISIIIAREYIRREGKALVATELGEVTTEFMKKHFPEIVDYEFTALLENQLDSIEHKDNTILGVIGSFYDKFSRELETVKDIGDEARVKPVAEESEFKCPKCSKLMVYKSGRFGKFLACPDYPACKTTVAVDSDGKPKAKEAESEPALAGFSCEKCGADMVIREGRFGKFYACKNYPTCKSTRQITTEIGVKCPKCDSQIVAKRARGNSVFYSCSNYPECDFSSWDKPLDKKCPVCSSMLYYRKTRGAVVCKNPSCEYRSEEEVLEK